MDQKVIYSMMGLAALPVVQAVAQSPYSWDGKQMTIGEGLVVQDGNTTSPTVFNIGKLLPGEYTLACKLTSKVYNVTVAVNGAKAKAEQKDINGTDQVVDISFVVADATKDITISFTTSDPGESGSGFSFSAPTVTLNFDFATIKTTLAGNANTLAGTISGYNYAAKQEDVDAAKALKTKAEGIAESYDDYNKFKLYLGSGKTTIDDEIAALADKAAKAEAAYQNEQAYNRVNAAITAIKAKYNTAVAELEAALINQAAYLLDAAKADLNTNINEKITEATQASYASYQAGTAVADEATNTGKVPTKEALNDIVNDWKGQGTTNQAAYNTLHGKVTTLQASLDAVKVADASMTATFAAERATAQSAIDAINTKVENAKNSAAQLTLDVTSDETAAQGKISTLAGKVNTANAEFNANKATIAAIALVQKAYNDAKTAVDAKVSKDGQYKASDYYAAYLKTQQDAIDKLTSDAAKAYKVDGTGSAQTYNAGLAAKTAPITTAIGDYQTNAIAAVAYYDALQTAIASYQTALDATRAKVKDLAVYTAEGYDYKTALDLIQKRINDIKKAITAAEGKVGAEHWAAMLAIDADAAITADIAALDAQYQADQNEYDANKLADGMTTLKDKITVFQAKDASKLGADVATFQAAETGIETAYNAVKAAKDAIDPNSDFVDYKAKVGTGEEAWKVGSLGHTGATPRTPGAGNIDGIQMIDQWNASADGTGTALVQTLTDLPNGLYTIELYASAVDQATGCPNKGKKDIAFVYANGVVSPVTVTDGAALNAYTLENVPVTEGKLEMGLRKDKNGTRWHLIQIKSLKANTASLIKGWGDKVAKLNEQQTALETVAASVAAKVTKNGTDKSTLGTNIDNLQTAMGTFATTYKIGQADSPLGLRGRDGGSVTTEVNAINTALGTLETNNNDVVVTAVDLADKTTGDLVAKDKWKNGEVHTAAGNNLVVNDMPVFEQWGYKAETGTLIVQTINNLPNGIYDLEVYAFASQGDATPGSTTNVHIYANGKTQPVFVSGKNGGNWPGNAAGLVAVEHGFDTYTIENIIVADGKLDLGLYKDQAGSEWHGIRIKSLTYHENTLKALANYNEAYTLLAARKTTLDNAAPGIKAAVEANAATNTAATKAVSDLQATELATLKSLKNVTNADAVSDDATAKKADPADFKVFETGLAADKSYTVRKAAIDADITAMSAAIAASYAAETLTTDWKNNSISVTKKVDDKDVTTTYSIATLTASINTLKADAAAESDNWEAYKALQDNNMSKLLPNYLFYKRDKDGKLVEPETALTEEEIKAITGDGAYAYYTGLKAQYITGKATILTNMQKALNERKAVAQKSSFVDQIAALIAKVNVVESDAEANFAKYNEQKKAYTETQTLWNSTYTEIAATDHSSKVQDWLDELDAIQVTLTEATNAVEENYPIGKSIDKAKDFAAIKAAINDVKARQSEAYNAQIAEDNKVAHETFMGNDTKKGTIQLATEAYQRAVVERAKYSSTNEDVKATIDALAATLDAALFNAPTAIANLTKAENDAYAATVSPTVFDVSSFNADAFTIEQNITNELKDFKDGVKDALAGYWNPEKTAFNAKVTAAEGAIASYSDDAKKDAFKDVKDLIAKADAGVNSLDLAKIEEAIAALEDIDDMLAADKDAAAAKDIAAALTAANKAYSDTKAYIEGKTIVDDVNNVKATQLQNLENAKAAAADAVEEYEPTFAGHDYIKPALDNVVTVANTAKTLVDAAIANDQANTKAYNDIIAAITPLEEKLAEAKAAAAPYKYQTSFATQDDLVEQGKSLAKQLKEAGTADANKATMLAMIGTYSTEVEDALTTAFGTEKAGLATDITELKNQFNAYVAAKGLDETATAFKADIDDLEKALNNAAIVEVDEPADGIKFNDIVAATEKLVVLQEAIADKQSELLEANASTANAEVLADFTAQLSDLAETASLVGYDEWVGNQPYGLTGKTLDEMITELQGEIADLQATIAAEPNIAFYKDQYQAQIDAIKDDVAPVAAAIIAKQAQFEANAEAYAALTGIIDGLQKSIDDAKEKVGAYEYAADDYTNLIEQYNDPDDPELLTGGAQFDLNAISAYVEYLNEAKNAQIYHPSTLGITTAVQDYLNNSANAELTAQKDYLYWLLLQAVDAKYVADTYSSALWDRLVAEEADIEAEIDDLGEAIDFSNQTYEWDDELQDWVYKPCTSDADYEAQMAIVKAIQEEIETLGEAVDNLDLLGDANVDGKVNVLDYQKVVNMILDPSLQPDEESDLFANLDINQSDVIEVGDLTAIVNYILEGDWQGYAAAKGKFAPAGESLSMASNTVSSGIQRLAINLNNVNDYTAFQMDVVLPEGMTIVGSSLGERAGESHKLYTRAQQDGSVRVLASSIKGEAFSGNEGAVVYIDVQTSAAFKGGSVEVLNILFSTTDAQTRSFSLNGDATGVDTVSTFEALKQKVYDLGGRLTNGLKKGINIIRRADGSAEKVLK